MIDPDLQRKLAAREGYIAWRMQDVPPIYRTLLPVSYRVDELWAAERSIRGMYADDMAYIEDPWRRVGPPCGILDSSGLTGTELMSFGLEVSVPVGLEHIPKRGREDELADEIARLRAASPAYADAIARLDAARAREDVADGARADAAADLDD